MEPVQQTAPLVIASVFNPLAGLFPWFKVHLLMRVDNDGIYREMRSDLFGLGRRVPIMDVRWSEIAKVERDNSGGLPGVRFFPKDSDRFRYRVGITRKNVPVAEDGSTRVVLTEAKAHEVYELCLRYLSGTPGSAEASTNATPAQ